MAKSEVDAWFAALPEEQRPVLAALRELVLAAAPGAAEELKWGRPCYSTTRGLFCYLHRTKSHATLGFQQGALLEDPAGLLQGTGKDMRHVKVAGLADIDEAALGALLAQALAR